MDRRMRIRAVQFAAAFLGAAVFQAGGCTGPLATEFRTAAGENLEQGVISIVTGVVQGFFAIVEPDPDTTG